MHFRHFRGLSRNPGNGAAPVRFLTNKIRIFMEKKKGAKFEILFLTSMTIIGQTLSEDSTRSLNRRTTIKVKTKAASWRVVTHKLVARLTKLFWGKIKLTFLD